MILVLIVLLPSLVLTPAQLQSSTSLQSKGSVILNFVQSIGNTRTVSIKQHTVVSRRTNDATNNWGEKGHEEVVTSCRKYLPTVENSRE